MKNNDLKDKEFRIFDPVESYFECISFCEIDDGTCVSKCVEILKDQDN